MYDLFVSMVQDFAKIAIVAVLILSLPLLDMTAITWTPFAFERGSVTFIFEG